MKKLTFVTLITLVTAVTGCLVTSVYPFYNKKDLIFDTGLVADRTKLQAPDEHWNFQRDGTNAYRLTFTSAGKSAVMLAHLFKRVFVPKGHCENSPALKRRECGGGIFESRRDG